MSGTVAPTPAPAPTNGSNGVHSAPTPTPKADTASGPQTPTRGPDGKFQGKPQESAPPPHPEKRRIKIKDVELDEDAAYAEIQRARQSSKLLTEAQKRAEAADKKEREFRERLERVKTKGDLGELLKDLDLSPEEERKLLAGHLYSRHIEPEQLSPEQKRIRELEAQVAERQRQDEEGKQKEQSAAERQAQEEAFREVENEINAAIESGKLPKSRLLVQSVATWLRRAEAAGRSIPIEHAVQLGKEDAISVTGEVVDSSSVQELEALWGEKRLYEHATKMSRWLVSKLGQQAGTQRQSMPARPQAQQGKPKRLTPQEFLRLQRGK